MATRVYHTLMISFSVFIMAGKPAIALPLFVLALVALVFSELTA